eukprot:TRINITY_DN4247_c1_g5_i1.p1 TRINITY_DN4247_c1_g5~~TRINITY_DN4247_c1_g5_i1.p1  ORF type:complete len:213 (+),score=36.85 TRINITY_DN4247_c1_g5_i1:61-699(+)
MLRKAALNQRRGAKFVPTVPPWKIGNTAWTAPAMKLYQKQLYSSHEWEQVGTPHNYLRYMSPGEPSYNLKTGAQFHEQWQGQYQNESLRQTGVTPQFREYAPPNPFYRDIYYEWLHRNVLDDQPGRDSNFAHEYTRVVETKERAPGMALQVEQTVMAQNNLDRRKEVKDEIRQELFEDYMRRRAKRNKQLGIDQYGTWSKKTLAYLKKNGDY